MIRNIFNSLLLISSLTFLSCGGGEKAEEIITAEEHGHPSLQESKFNAQNVFNSMPDRKLVMHLIEENKVEYNPDLLNDPTAVNKYSIEFAKAVNLGIYGSDLSIASSFDQTQESMTFLKCVNVLAGQLGVNSAFDQHMFERIDANLNNNDSTLEIVIGAFRKVDEILKYNNRPATSAVILTGCWIEGLYVSCQMAQSIESEDIVKAIVHQKESLQNVLVMIEAVTLEPKDQFIYDDLKSLLEAFNTAETATKYDKKAITNITKRISDLRNKLTSISTS